jgi:hypothetical protein
MSAQRSDPGATVDILIMILLLVTAILAYRGLRARVIISLWALTLVATLLLFNYHVTSSLNLNF